MERIVWDAAVVGGGPAGATAAEDLARAGRRVALLERGGRIKPCGGAIPPRLVRDFAIPEHLMVARVDAARIVAPSGRAVPMPVEGGGYVGMVDREVFDPWLRERAALAGAEVLTGGFERYEPGERGAPARVHWRDASGAEQVLLARAVIGADGARSPLARQALPGQRPPPCVFAYHEVVRAPEGEAGWDGATAEVHYDGRLSPDFYAWVFPHGRTASVGTGSARKGFGLRAATTEARARVGLAGAETLRREGAPIPMRPRRRWDDGRHVVLAGDAAGVVAPASGEGIYYAMLGGRLAAEAAEGFLASGEARHLATARRRFNRLHGRVFLALGLMQWFWYRSDWTRERFVRMCADPDVQRLTWEAYVNKELVRNRPVAHARVFLKDAAQLLGIARA